MTSNEFPTGIAFYAIGNTGHLSFIHALMASIFNYNFTYDENLPFEKSLEPRIKNMRPTDYFSPKFFYGHCTFGAHEHYRAPLEYMTMLRHPISKAISDYKYYLKQLRAGQDTGSVPVAALASFDAYLDWAEAISHVGGWLADWLVLHCYSTTDYQACKTAAAKIAYMIEKTQNTFNLVVINEFMEEFIILLTQRLAHNLDPAIWTRVSLSASHVKRDEVILTPTQQARLEALLAVDLTVYAHFRQIADNFLNEYLRKPEVLAIYPKYKAMCWRNDPTCQERIQNGTWRDFVPSSFAHDEAFAKEFLRWSSVT